MKEFPSLFTKCTCGSEIFEIQRYIEDEYEDRGFYLSFWKYGRTNSPMTWKERLRWCVRILRTGDPWADGIIVSENNAKLISEYINKTL